MSHVFISYSRRDAEFVQRLNNAFVAANRVVWIDWQSIPRGEDWWREIEIGIEGGDSFICVISEHWLTSEICHKELAHARQNHKRVLPVIRQPIRDAVEKQVKGTWMDTAWEQTARENWDFIRHLNWVFFDADSKFDGEFQALLTTLDEDQPHVKAHTRYQNRALEWDRSGHNPSFLLAGDDLDFAETWVSDGKDKLYSDMQFYMRGESERSSSEGAFYVTNIQQLYPEQAPADDEPSPMAVVLGRKPPTNGTGARDDMRERITARPGRLMFINDEAHHTHDANSTWNETIRALHSMDDSGLAAQLDFSATPRYSGGGLFAWTVSDYTLKQAILDGIVKRPVKGITDAQEVASSVARIKYEPFITAGVERWKEYRDVLEPLGKKPLLFVMMNDTAEADDIGDYLRVKYPSEFGGDCTSSSIPSVMAKSPKAISTWRGLPSAK